MRLVRQLKKKRLCGTADNRILGYCAFARVSVQARGLPTLKHIYSSVACTIGIQRRITSKSIRLKKLTIAATWNHINSTFAQQVFAIDPAHVQQCILPLCTVFRMDRAVSVRYRRVFFASSSETAARLYPTDNAWTFFRIAPLTRQLHLGPRSASHQVLRTEKCIDARTPKHVRRQQGPLQKVTGPVHESGSLTGDRKARLSK